MNPHSIASVSTVATTGKMIVRGKGIDMPLRQLSPYLHFDMEIYDSVMKLMRERYLDWLR